MTYLAIDSSHHNKWHCYDIIIDHYIIKYKWHILTWQNGYAINIEISWHDKMLTLLTYHDMKKIYDMKKCWHNYWHIMTWQFFLSFILLIMTWQCNDINNVTSWQDNFFCHFFYLLWHDNVMTLIMAYHDRTNVAIKLRPKYDMTELGHAI